MASLVEELQRDALNPLIRISDLLRKARTIARKLDLPELAAWVQNELNGYTVVSDVPHYRAIKGELKGLNPFHGWVPAEIADKSLADRFTTWPLFQKVAELEDLVANSSGNALTLTLNGNHKQALRTMFRVDVDFAVKVSGSSIVGVLDAVRNSLLDWSLDLEAAGIKGEGMSFSNDERKKAHEEPTVYNIGSIHQFTGNIGSGNGDVTVGGNLVNGDSQNALVELISRIRSSESQLGLAPEPARDLNQALYGLHEELKSASPKRSVVKGFIDLIGDIAMKAGSNFAVQGIVHELSKLNLG